MATEIAKRMEKVQKPADRLCRTVVRRKLIERGVGGEDLDLLSWQPDESEAVKWTRVLVLQGHNVIRARQMAAGKIGSVPESRVSLADLESRVSRDDLEREEGPSERAYQADQEAVVASVVKMYSRTDIRRERQRELLDRLREAGVHESRNVDVLMPGVALAPACKL